MLNTKNRDGKSGAFLLLILALFAGCTPPGPRALAKGKRLVDKGLYVDAIGELKQASSMYSNTNAEVWNYLGLAYQGAGQWTNAAPAYQKALALNPKLGEVHYNLGCLWLEQNRLESAKAELTSYTSLPGSGVEGWLKLGTVQLRARELALAEKSFKEALRISSQEPEALNGLGLIQLQRNLPREAAQYFEEALKQQPDYPPALLNLAVVLQLHLNDRKLALEKYREYLALPERPADWDDVNATARALEQEVSGSAHPAATVVSATTSPSGGSVAKVTPGSPGSSKPEPTANATGIASSRAPASENAARPATQPAVRPAQDVPSPLKPTEVALELPSVAPPPATTGAAKAENPGFFSRINPLNWFRRDPDPSVAGKAGGSVPGTYARYKYLAPARPAVGDESAAGQAFVLGVQAQQANRLPEAIKAYRKATRLNPAYFDAQYNLGLVAASAGELPQALLAYETALAIRPDSSAARYNFALVLKQANYPLDAASELDRVLLSSPRDARVHLALGNLYAQQLRQPAKAREHYQKVLEYDPQTPQAAAIRNWLSITPP